MDHETESTLGLCSCQLKSPTRISRMQVYNLPSQNGRVINRLGVGHQHVYLSCQVLRNDATAICEWRELCFATIELISKRFPSRTFPITTEENLRSHKSTKLSISRLGSIRKDQALSRCRKIGVLQRDGRERLDI